MTTETKRDLQADLALCEAATTGPWEEFYGVDILKIGVGACQTVAETVIDEYGVTRYPDAKFIAESREGWSHAIHRAVAAEAEVERLRESERWLKALVAALDDGRIAKTRLSSGTDYVVLSARMHVQNLDSPDTRSETVTSDTEVERLREILSGIFAKAQNDVARWDGGMCVGTPVFQDRPYTRRLVDEIRPVLFPEVTADAPR